MKRALRHLFDIGLLSSPDDDGALTDAGKLAGQLPVDLHLGRFVSFGALMGLAEEASVMAAAMSLPKSPFRIANSLIHTDVDEYNKIVREGDDTSHINLLTIAHIHTYIHTHPLPP